MDLKYTWGGELNDANQPLQIVQSFHHRQLLNESHKFLMSHPHENINANVLYAALKREDRNRCWQN